MPNLQDDLMLAVARAIIDPPPTSLEMLGLASLPREQALELAERAGKAHDAERFGHVSNLHPTGEELVEGLRQAATE